MRCAHACALVSLGTAADQRAMAVCTAGASPLCPAAPVLPAVAPSTAVSSDAARLKRLCANCTCFRVPLSAGSGAPSPASPACFPLRTEPVGAAAPAPCLRELARQVWCSASTAVSGTLSAMAMVSKRRSCTAASSAAYCSCRSESGRAAQSDTCTPVTDVRRQGAVAWKLVRAARDALLYTAKATTAYPRQPAGQSKHVCMQSTQDSRNTSASNHRSRRSLRSLRDARADMGVIGCHPKCWATLT